jgi:PAS domain S-box-containing protein
MFFSLERKIIVGFCVALTALLVMASAAWWSITRFETTFRWVDHTHQVLFELEALLNQVEGMQVETQRYVINGDDSGLKRWATDEKQARDSLALLDELTRDNPVQQQRLRQLEPLIAETVALTRQRHVLRQQAGQAAALAETGKGAVGRVVNEITQRVQAAETAERDLLKTRSAETQAAGRLTIFVAAGSCVLVAGLAGLAVVLALRDLTARHKAEAELDRFFTLTHDLLCIAGFDGYFKRLNPAWERTLGFTTAELTGRPFVEFIHPDDRAPTQSQAARQAGGLEAMAFENRYLCKDGSYRWLQWNARPMQDEQLIFATARDVTDTKKVAQIHLQFRSLFESLPGLYLVLTPDFRIVAVSDAYLKATMTQRTQILGRGLFEVFPDNPNDPGATGVSNLRTSLNRVLQTAAPDTMAVQKYDVRGPDGTFEVRFWSPINSPVLGTDRQIEYIIHRVEDVTDFIRQKSALADDDPGPQTRLDLMEAEIFRSAQQVQAANQQLHAANAELEAFSYSVSHDLRAPLRHIDGFAGLLAKHAAGSLDEKGNRYVSVISESARKMGRLIDDLLAFSRMGRTQMHLVQVDQNELVAGVIRDGRFNREDRPIEWVVSPLPRVRADAALLRQVWFNFIDNAVKYSGKVPQPRIEIGAQPGATPLEQACFVRDNGAGFDLRYVDKLFGVFQRLHTEAEFPGTGIGLANVRRIILRHGGRVWAEGAPGAGSTFYFSLPVSDPAAPAA